jgi:hypothetical protein
MEVDAIPPPLLLDPVRTPNARHVDPARVVVLAAAEASARELLGSRAGMLGSPPRPQSRPAGSDL